MRGAFSFAGLMLLAACASRGPAPVAERAPEPAPTVENTQPIEPPPVEKPVPTHVVKPKETLVGIALQYGLDYRELAAWNNITNPNALKVGQILVVAAPTGARPTPVAPQVTPLANAGPIIEARPLVNTPAAKVEPRGQKLPFSDRALAQLGSPDAAAAPGSGPVPGPAVAPPAAPPSAPPPSPAPAEPPARGTETEDVSWIWPAKGRILSPFSEASKGIDIAGKKGAPVLAAAPGRVVYAGGGLRGYGKLVIIKHNDTWLSAYAHNENLVVKEQQDVKRGQKIAEMGATDADQVKLHFEVRRQGKPVDPAKLLPQQ
jgi:lipoprotein NlpD